MGRHWLLFWKVLACLASGARPCQGAGQAATCMVLLISPAVTRHTPVLLLLQCLLVLLLHGTWLTCLASCQPCSATGRRTRVSEPTARPLGSSTRTSRSCGINACRVATCSRMTLSQRCLRPWALMSSDVVRPRSTGWTGSDLQWVSWEWIVSQPQFGRVLRSVTWYVNKSHSGVCLPVFITDLVCT